MVINDFGGLKMNELKVSLGLAWLDWVLLDQQMLEGEPQDINLRNISIPITTASLQLSAILWKHVATDLAMWNFTDHCVLDLKLTV